MYAVKEVEVAPEGWNIKTYNFGESNPCTRKCDHHPLCHAPHRPISPFPPVCLFSTDDEYSIRLIHVAKEVVLAPRKSTTQGNRTPTTIARNLPLPPPTSHTLHITQHRLFCPFNFSRPGLWAQSMHTCIKRCQKGADWHGQKESTTKENRTPTASMARMHDTISP